MTTIPTLNTLYTQIKTDLETQYGISISIFGKVALRAVAMAQAGKMKILYLVLGNLQKNIFVDTADPESVGGTLERFGRVKLGRNPFAPIAGQYTVDVTGSIGGVIPAQTVFKSDDTSTSPGFMFVLDNAYTLVSTTDSITLRCLTAGVEAKLNIADTLTATAPIALVDSVAVVTAVLVQAQSSEAVEDYRFKVIQSYRLEPQGGAATDYRLWSQDAQGVQRVYPYARSGYPSEVNLYVEATTIDSTDGKGTPTPTILTAVESVVNYNPDVTLPVLERGRRPLQVVVNYLPAIPKDVDIEISSYVNLTPTKQAKIDAALAAYIDSVRPFIDSADNLADKKDTIDVNNLIGVIITADPGALFGAVSFTVAGVSYSTYQFIAGNIPFNNSISYV